MRSRKGCHRETVDGALLKQALYRFFAILLRYPEDERLSVARIAAGCLEDSLGARVPWGGEVDDHVAGIIAWVKQSGADVQGLQREWDRLFGEHPDGGCFPYEGAGLPPEAAPLIVGQLRREYAAAGAALPAEELPDFVGVELEFLAHLCSLERRADASTDHAGRQHARRARLTFLDRHICRWLPQLATRVQHHGGGAYSEVCHAAVAFAAQDKAQLAATLTPAWPRPSRKASSC